jgi:hypothetical protein
MPGVDFNVETQLHFLKEVFPAFREEHADLPQGKTSELRPYDFYFGNNSFDVIDALVLYCMVRHFKPRRIIEVGSGFSSMITARAARKNGHTELFCIEPYPSEFIRTGFPGLTCLLPQKVEEVPLTFFQSLGEGDILFIDTSHMIRINGDVTYLYLEILPRLAKGVVIHIHDIFLPLDYPKRWVNDLLLFWNEQYLLQAFLACNPHFKVLFACDFMRRKYESECRAAFPNCPFFSAGQSFWMQRVS